MDGYARGRRSFDPILVKTQSSDADHELVQHALFRLPETCGVYHSTTDNPEARDATGSGFFTLLHTLESPAFPDSKVKVGPLAEVPLGVAEFKRA